MRLVVRPALALCLVLASAVPAFGTVAFNVTEEPVDSARNPQAVTLADITGDSIDDAIVVDIGDSVVVFFNDGQGELEEDDFYETGEVPVAVATGLFNADTFVDIVVVNNVSNTVSILYNDGEGRFDGDLESRQVPVGARPNGIAVADFNGDSEPDLAVLSPNLIYLLQSNGDGTFSAFNPPTINTGSTDSFTIAAGNLDSGGTIDLAVTNRANNQVAIFLGGGDGTFEFNGFAPAGGIAPTGLIIADPDQNQTNDLVVALSQGDITTEMSLLSNAGDGTFGTAQLFTGPIEPLAITGLDIEPDGKIDLAITSILGDEIFILCQPSNFCDGDAVEAGIWRSAEGGTVRGCADAPQVAIASGKLNGDDKDDFVALKGEDEDIDTLCIALNQSEPGRTPVPTPTTPGAASPTPSGPTATPTVTPTATPTPTSTEIPTIGLGVCNTNSAPGFPELGRPVALANSDFDRNGVQDVAVADATGNRVVVLLEDMFGPSDPSMPCSALDVRLGAEIPVDAPEAVLAADFDVNGRADLAVIGAGGLYIFYGDGAGSFTPATSNPRPAGVDPTDIALADLNRDLTPDLIVTDSGSANVSIFIGTRELATPFLGPCAMAVQGRNNAAVSADLNNDGRNDFAVTSPQSRDIAVFLQVANAQLNCTSMAASFQGQTRLTLPGDPVGLMAGTFGSGDTIPDLVVAMTKQDANGTVLLFQGQVAGSGVTYQRGTETLVPTPVPAANLTVPSAIGSGDLERDGRRDILITDNANDNLTEFRGQSSGGLGVGLIPESVQGDGPVALIVVDLDDDGRDDVVTANANDGSLSYMLSDQRMNTPIPTPTTPAPTGTATAPVGTPTSTPTITQTPTRSRRPSSTPTPVPSNTQRGVVTLSGNGCAIGEGSNGSGTFLLAGFALALMIRRRAVRLQG